MSEISDRLVSIAVAKNHNDAISRQLALSIIDSEYISFVLYAPSVVSDLLANEGKFLGKEKKSHYTNKISKSAISATMTLYKDGDAYRVAAVAATDGFGPMMYETASNHLGWIKPDIKISDSAKRVWKRFYERDDVETRPVDDSFIDEEYLGYEYKISAKMNYKPLLNRHKRLVLDVKRDHELHPGDIRLMLERAGILFFQAAT